jgi:hypothetical protein
VSYFNRKFHPDFTASEDSINLNDKPLRTFKAAKEFRARMILKGVFQKHPYPDIVFRKRGGRVVWGNLYRENDRTFIVVGRCLIITR